MSSRRNSSSSLHAPQPSRRNSRSNTNDQDQLSSDDGYDYNSVDEAPEAEPTKVKVQGEAHVHAQDDQPSLPTILKKDDPDVTFEETRPNIYQRRFAGRWAQVPDEEKAIANGATWAHRENESQPRIETNLSTASRDSVKARHIALPWKLARTDTKLILELNLAAPLSKSKDEVLPKRVLWQHTEQKLLGIHKLEEEIANCQSRGLSESEVGLMKRLLERVRSTAEKSFVGGKFLVPTALRYDSQDVSRYTVDKTCIFFSFPYFSVADASHREYAGKGKPEHPPRTLLQSRYRLHQTVDRDEKQCIRLLNGKGVESSISVQAGDNISIPKKGTQHLVYVPQLWGVIIGLDTLVTCGPISESALQSSFVVTQKTKPISTKSKLALVRIQFEHNNEREDLIYPISQCNSWLGLLNKQQQIIEFLGDEKSKAKPKDYRFWLNNTQLTIANWTAFIDEFHSTEMLSIWMKSEVPEIKVSPAGDASGSPSTDPANPNVQNMKTIKAPDLTSVISPILAWPILDSFGEVDKQPVSTRIERFLTRIYIFLFMGDGIHKQQRAMRPTLANAQHSALSEKIPNAVKTLLELEQYITTECKSEPATEIFQKFHKIFCVFIPEEHDENLISIQLYWGAVHEICEATKKQDFQPALTELLKALDSIVYHGIRLHQGVYCKVDSQDRANQTWTRKETLAEGTILLATMVDAFGVVFHMLVEILRFLRRKNKATDADLMGSDFKVKAYGSDAIKYLKAGWDQLVRELHGRDKSNTIGPVVTPEAITIKLMERLVFGVFQKSQIDIIHLYEECLEHLSLKVESEASRRLLQRINIFQDEVAIINRVLNEQHDVLLSLCKSLDPTSFRSPSIARKLRYNFECTSIEKVLALLKEQIKNCSELQERAKQLAVQNVQLVETLQDDQSRAIFVFTIVTIIFLPLSFIAGFFGMNFNDITSSTYDVRHFWEVAAPLTFAVFLLCTLIAFKGEAVFNWVSRGYRWLARTWRKEKQKKN